MTSAKDPIFFYLHSLCPQKTVQILESPIGCTVGRATLCEDAEEDVPTVVSKMMTDRHDGAVAVLCHRHVHCRTMDEGGLRLMALDGWS